jgi:hypothetical protein
LRVGDPLGGPEDFEKLVALPRDPSKETEFLENERPGNQGEE